MVGYAPVSLPPHPPTNPHRQPLRRFYAVTIFSALPLRFHELWLERIKPPEGGFMYLYLLMFLVAGAGFEPAAFRL